MVELNFSTKRRCSDLGEPSLSCSISEEVVLVGLLRALDFYRLPVLFSSAGCTGVGRKGVRFSLLFDGI